MQLAQHRGHSCAGGGLTTRELAALAAFFLSGAAGLVYEVAWIRRASLVFGSTTYALSLVLAVFFLGLAAGSELFGRLSRRLSRPLAAYAALELGLAALALLSVPAFSLADALLGALARASGGGETPWLARVALVSLVILPPTLLMGGTLPLFCHHFVRERTRIAGSVGALYALNTLGATAGCLLAGFALIPRLGVTGSIALGAGLNVASALLAAWARLVREPRPQPAAREPRAAPAGWSAAIAALFFATGFTALGQEVIWTRFLSLVISNNVYTYTLTLAAALLGIVIGSLAASRWMDRASARARWFAWLQIGFALSVLALGSLPPAAWASLGGSLGVIFALLLPPAVLSGAAFPLAVRMVVDDPDRAGSGVGRMLALNTLGGILGSLAIGFFALPHLGLGASLKLTSGASLLAGAAAWLGLDRESPLAWRAAGVAVCAALWAALPLASGTRVPADFLANGGELVAFREGLESNVAVIRRGSALELEIDRWWQGSDKRSHQIVAAHVPALLHPRPRRVLVVGVGVGQTAERFLMHDVAVLDCVDIEPAVFDLIDPYFGGAWLADPRVRLIRDDGRNAISHGAGSYDIVSLELGQITRPGVASFYSVDFYRSVRERLAPGGLVAQFVPLPFLSPPLLRSVVRSFLEVFPASVLWYNLSELLLIGSPDSLALGSERLAQLTANPRLREDLRYSAWGGPEHWLERPQVFLGGLLAGRRGLEAFAAGAALLRDDPPRLAYAANEPSPEHASANELDFVASIRPHLATVAEALGLELDTATAEAAARERERNLGDIAATAELRLYRVHAQEWPPERLLPIVERALAANPEKAEARLAAGQLLVQLGRLDAAAAELARLIELRPDDARGHRWLGMLRHRQRRFADAIAHYRAALAVEPDAATHYHLGAALLESGVRGEASEQLTAALALDPSLTEARRLLERIGPARSSPP